MSRLYVTFLHHYSVLITASQERFTCSRSTVKTLDKGVKYIQNVLIVNFDHISHIVLVFSLLTLLMFAEIS